MSLEILRESQSIFWIPAMVLRGLALSDVTREDEVTGSGFEDS